jgi:uncharacterized protein YdhG (YjbR/CyaY superfamily)
MKKPKSVADYLAALEPQKRAALQRLRASIKAAAPKAEECISYGLPAFRQDGRMLAWYGAAKAHCSFYPGGIVGEFRKELAKYDVSKGTIRFAPDEPLPATLVRKIVKARIAQNAARSSHA